MDQKLNALAPSADSSAECKPPNPITSPYEPYKPLQTPSSNFYSNLHPFTSSHPALPRFAASIASQTSHTPREPEETLITELLDFQTQAQIDLILEALSLKNFIENSGYMRKMLPDVPRANSSYIMEKRRAFRANLPQPPPGRLLAGRKYVRWEEQAAAQGTPVCVETNFSSHNPSTIAGNEPHYDSALAFVSAPAVHTQRPAGPPGFPVPNPISYEHSIPVVGDRVMQLLPKNLQIALDEAELARHKKLPSVLEPKTDAVEISHAHAIIYLLSLIPSGSPRLAASTGSRDQLLNERAVDIAFYDPTGTYLIPVREIILRSTTSLSLLVLELQSLLDQNIEELNRMSSGSITDNYLVFSVQIRMFSDTRFMSCPKVSGEVGGADEAHGAEYVQWLCNKGDMEMYWNLYRRTIQLRSDGTGMPALTKPMFKIRTVKKLPSPHDHLLGGGGHTFISTPNVVPFILPAPSEPKRKPTTVVQEEKRKVITSESELGPEDRALFDSIMSAFSGKDSKGVSKKDILAAVVDGLNARLAGEDAYKALQYNQDGLENSDLYKSYAENSTKYRKEHGFPVTEQVDPKRNWAYYQRMGGNPEVHEACDLSKHPFEIKDMPSKGYYDRMHDPRTYPTEEQMVPFQEIPASVFKIRCLSPDERAMLQRYTSRKERAISFDNEDDEEFFPVGNGFIKPCTNSPTLVSPTPKKPSRIDTDSILTSVHMRKNMQNSHLSGMNRPMSPSPLQNITNARVGSGSAENSVSLGYSNLSQSAGSSFYDMTFTDQEVPENWANRVNTLQGQASYYNSNNMANLDNLVQNDYATGSSRGRNTARNDMANFGSMQQNENIGPNAQAMTSGSTIHINKLRANTQPQAHSSLSEFGSMLKTKNPTLGTLNSFNQPIANGNSNAGNQPGSYGTVGTPTPAYTQRSRGGAPRTAHSHARSRVGSALRAESPAFKMNLKRTPAGSQGTKLGSGLAVGMMKLQVDDAAGQGSESSPNASFNSQ